MATAPRLRSNSPDTSELGIRVFSPRLDKQESAIQIDSPVPKPSPKKVPYENLSEREQVRQLWGNRRRKHRKTRKANKKRRSTRRK